MLPEGVARVLSTMQVSPRPFLGASGLGAVARWAFLVGLGFDNGLAISLAGHLAATRWRKR